MRQFISALLVVAFVSGCSFISINGVPTAPPTAEKELKAYKADCVENRESAAPHVDLAIASAGLIMAGVAFGLGAACEAPADAEWGEGYDCLGYLAPVAIGGLVTLIYSPSAIYGYVYKNRCSE